jgi:hypothetical protein
MYCPETIRKLNAEHKYSITGTDSTIDEAILNIKCALNRATELHNEIKAVRSLKKISCPEKISQLDLAEKFYIARRRAILNLQHLALELNQALEDGKILLKRYENDRDLLEGRIMAAKASGNSKILSIATPEYEQVLNKIRKVSTTMLAIEETLKEYSAEYSRPISDSECKSSDKSAADVSPLAYLL